MARRSTSICWPPPCCDFGTCDGLSRCQTCLACLVFIPLSFLVVALGGKSKSKDEEAKPAEVTHYGFEYEPVATHDQDARVELV